MYALISCIAHIVPAGEEGTEREMKILREGERDRERERWGKRECKLKELIRSTLTFTFTPHVKQ